MNRKRMCYLQLIAQLGLQNFSWRDGSPCAQHWNMFNDVQGWILSNQVFQEVSSKIAPAAQDLITTSQWYNSLSLEVSPWSRHTRWPLQVETISFWVLFGKWDSWRLPGIFTHPWLKQHDFGGKPWRDLDTMSICDPSGIPSRLADNFRFDWLMTWKFELRHVPCWIYWCVPWYTWLSDVGAFFGVGAREG